jgi:hypothetical protein
LLQRSLPPIRLLVQGIDAETSGEDEDAAADGDVQGFAAPSVRHADGFEEASVVVGQRIGALVVSGEAFFLTQRNQLVELAAQHAIPTIYAYREFPIAGGLMSYGGDYTEPLVCSEYTPAEFSRGSSRPIFQFNRPPRSS